MKSAISIGRRATLAACLVACSVIAIEGCGKAKDGPREVDRAIELAKKEAIANRFDLAQDAILVAARLEPTNPKVLAAALQLVTDLADRNETDGLDVANDLYVQVSSLIPYQSVDAVSEARSKYEKTGELLAEKLTSSSKPPSESPPLQQFTRLLEAVTLSETAASNRLELLRVARAELDSLAMRLIASSEQVVGISQVQLDAESKRLAAAETAALTSLYSESLQTELRSWRDVEANTLVESARAASKDPAELLKKIKDSVSKGYRLRADAAPYVEAGITSAIEDVRSSSPSVEARLNDLERCRTWLENRLALNVIEEATKPEKPFDKLRVLAKIRDDGLESYVRRRLEEEWEKAFNELSEDDKVKAVQMRILGGL